MPDTKSQDVGLYNASAPALAVGQYGTLEDLIQVTAGLTTQSGGGKVSLSGNNTAEAWYVLEEKVGAATKRLDEVNQAFQREIKSLQDCLKGEAGDAYHDYAKDLLKKSEDLLQTLESKQYATTIGNIGHAIQAFGDAWWDTIHKSDEARNEVAFELKAIAEAEAAAATSTSQLQGVIDDLKSAMKEMDKAAKDQLVKDLQQLLTGLGNQYNARGQDLSPLHIAGGHTTGSGGSGHGGSGHGGSGHGGSGHSGSGHGGSGHGSGKGSSDDFGDVGEEPSTMPAEMPGELEQGQPLGELDPASEGAAPSGSGAGGAGGALDQAKKAATDAIDGVKGGTTDPEAQKALDDAKKAVGDAIDGIGGTGGEPESSSAAPGETSMNGLAPDPAAASALDQAKKAATDAIDGVKAGTTDPEAQKALDDAKKAVGDAIDGIGGGVPGLGGGDGLGGSDSPAQQRRKALDDAKKAATDAINGVGADTTDPEADKALDQAKEDAAKAIDGLKDSAVSPEVSSALNDAKDKALDAIDDVAAKTTDPEVKKALEEAKKAVGEAIDGIKTDGGIKDGGIKTDGDLPSTLSDGPGSSALDDAKARAIDGLTDEDPEARKALDDAKEAADKTFDDLIDKTTDPEAKQALEDAKEAVGKAIDGIEPAGGEGSEMHDFLSGDRVPASELEGLGGGGGGAPDSKLDGLGGGLGGGGLGDGLGGGGGGGAGTGHFATTSGGPDGPGRAQFDTDVAQQRGFAPAGLQPTSSTIPVRAVNPDVPAGTPMGGMPMGGMPMGMGGMGGMGGGQQQNEREPQIWLQADKDAWTEDPDSSGDPVLGRSSSHG